MEAMDFVEKRSSYLEKASHSIEKKRFVVQNAGGQPLLWNFKGDISFRFKMHICAIGSINSHDFHIIGDKLINPVP